MAEGDEVAALHRKLYVASERVLELEKIAEKQRRRTEEEAEKVRALESTTVFLRAYNALLLKENRQLTRRVGEFERFAARQVDGLVASSAEMVGLVAKKESALAAFLDAERFPQFSSRYTVPVTYESGFYDAIQSMDGRQVDIIKRAIRSLVDHGAGGTPKQSHRKVERPIDGIPVPVGAMMSFASRKLRYFWTLFSLPKQNPANVWCALFLSFRAPGCSVSRYRDAEASFAGGGVNS